MAIEYEVRDGALVWIKNPITGVISYVVDVRGKSFAFTLGGREELAELARPAAEWEILSPAAGVSLLRCRMVRVPDRPAAGSPK